MTSPKNNASKERPGEPKLPAARRRRDADEARGEGSKNRQEGAWFAVKWNGTRLQLALEAVLRGGWKATLLLIVIAVALAVTVVYWQHP